MTCNAKFIVWNFAHCKYLHDIKTIIQSNFDFATVNIATLKHVDFQKPSFEIYSWVRANIVKSRFYSFCIFLYPKFDFFQKSKNIKVSHPWLRQCNSSRYCSTSKPTFNLNYLDTVYCNDDRERYYLVSKLLIQNL